MVTNGYRVNKCLLNSLRLTLFLSFSLVIREGKGRGEGTRSQAVISSRFWLGEVTLFCPLLLRDTYLLIHIPSHKLEERYLAFSSIHHT